MSDHQSFQTRSPCLLCGEPVYTYYIAPTGDMTFSHDVPLCDHSFALLVGLGGKGRTKQAAQLAAVAEFIVGWDVMSWLIAETGDTSDL